MISLRSLSSGLSNSKKGLAYCVASRFYTASSNDAPTMPECGFEFEGYWGQSYANAMRIHKTKLLPCIVPYYEKPLMLCQGRMQWVWDVHGKRYLDMLGGVVTLSVGHCHPKVTEKTKKQMDTLWHTTSNFMTPPIYDYIEKLTSTLPGELKVCFFTNSGAEANDVALLMARVHTGSFDAVSLKNGYHGASPYSIGLTGHGSWKHHIANGFGIHHAMNPDPYRGQWGGAHCRDSLVQTDRTCSCSEGHCEAEDKYLAQLEEILEYSVPPKIAGFFVEPIQGVGGIVQYPKGYLKKAFDLVRSKGGLCVSDEVQTGLGRLGSHKWGFETHGVLPDIITTAKGVGNGYPMGVVVTTPKVAESMRGVSFFNTFGGNPVACTAAGAVLDVLEQENKQQYCAELGTYFLIELKKLRNKYDFIGDVRGKGLMMGIELVANRNARTPVDLSRFTQILEDIRQCGVILGQGGHFGNVLRITPPMCVTKDDVDFTLAVLDHVFQSQQDRDVDAVGVTADVAMQRSRQ